MNHLWKSAFRLTPNNRAQSVGNSVRSQSSQTRKNNHKNKNYSRNRKTRNRYQYEPVVKQRRSRRRHRGGMACKEDCINMR